MKRQIILLGIPFITLLGWGGLGTAALADEFIFDGSQLEKTFTLHDTESHTVYEDRQVPDTCYRQVLDGYDTQCHTETEQDCHNEQRTECTPTTRRECTDITRRECHQESRPQCHQEYQQQCHQENRRQCTPITRRECRDVPSQVCTPTTRHECHTENVCRNVQDQVCRGEGANRVCTPITRRECHQENQCRDVPSQDCHTVNKTECRDVPDQVCRDHFENVCQNVPREVCIPHYETVCRDVPDQVCRNVPDQICRTIDVPVCHPTSHQECEQVPRYRNESYSCTRTERVAVGTEVDFNITGNIQAKFDLENVSAKPNEKFAVTMKKTDVDFKLVQPSGQFLISMSKKIDTQTPAPKQKVVTAQYKLGLVSIADMVSPVRDSIDQIEVKNGHLRFTLGKVFFPDLLALKLTLVDTLNAVNLFDGTLATGTFQFLDAGARTLVDVDLSKLSLNDDLPGTNFGVVVEARVLADKIQNLLNPQAMPQQLTVSKSAQFGQQVNAEALFSPIQNVIHDVAFDDEGKVLRFTVGKVYFPQFTHFGLEILTNSRSLFNGELKKGTFELREEDGSTVVRVDLAKLKLSDKIVSGRFQVQTICWVPEEVARKFAKPNQMPDNLRIDEVTTLDADQIAYDLRKALSPLSSGIEKVDISPSGDTLYVTIGEVFYPQSLILHLKLTLQKSFLFVKYSKKIFDGQVEAKNYRVEATTENKSRIAIRLTDLADIKSGSYSIAVGLQLDRSVLESHLKDQEVEQIPVSPISKSVRAKIQN